jgi:hypothetical protein
VQGALTAFSRLQQDVATSLDGRGTDLAAVNAQRAIALAAQEQALRQRESAAAAERAKIEALTAEMQSSVAELRGAHGAEKARLLLEHERLQALSEALQRERAVLAAEAAAERRAIEEARGSRESEAMRAAAEMETQRASLRLAHEATALERDRMARERALNTTAKAQAETTLRAQVAELAAERSLLDDAKVRVAAEVAEIASARAAFERERAAFAEDVEALKHLSVRVHEESAAVRDASHHSSRQLAASRELAAIAEAERAAADEAREVAEMAVREVVETRRAFESERLAAAKERKEMSERRQELERAAEATRTLQLQLSRHMGAEATKAADGDAAAPPQTARWAAAEPRPVYTIRPRARPQPYAPQQTVRQAWRAPPAVRDSSTARGVIEEVGSPPRRAASHDQPGPPAAQRTAQPSQAAGAGGTVGSLLAAADWRHTYDQTAQAIRASHNDVIAKLRAPPSMRGSQPAAVHLDEKENISGAAPQNCACAAGRHRNPKRRRTLLTCIAREKGKRTPVARGPLGGETRQSRRSVTFFPLIPT